MSTGQTWILYHDRPGPTASGHTVEAAVKRGRETGIATFVVASATGKTALDLAQKLQHHSVPARVIGVSYAQNYSDQWEARDPLYVEPARELGVIFIQGTHAFGGINSAIKDKWHGWTPTHLMGETLYLFGQGMKVALEVTMMAADQGQIEPTQEIIALGGSGKGCDTAVVLTPACTANVFALKVHEIVCMPRHRRVDAS